MLVADYAYGMAMIKLLALFWQGVLFLKKF